MVISKDKPVIEGKLMKKKVLKDSPAIQVGETFIGHYFDKPEIGKSFIFFISSKSLNSFRANKFGPFQTTSVTKIIDEFTFETKNSVYYLIDKVREREVKIETLLNEKESQF
jgi:hypothetical protein